MTFRLTTLLWLFALFASAMGTFGPTVGIVLVGVVLAAYAAGRALRAGGMTRIEVAGVTAIVVVLVGLLLPAVQSGGSTAGRSRNLATQWTLAILNYEATQGRFPPAYSTDNEGRPLHSWRTLLLPYSEDAVLYRQVRTDQPWGSPHNQRLLVGHDLGYSHTPRPLPREPAPDEASYFAVVDDEAVFTNTGEVTLSDITDGPENTIILIEAGGRGVAWYEPRDLTLDEAVDLLCGDFSDEFDQVEPGFFASTIVRGDGLHWRCVGFADGRVKFVGVLADREEARALLTRAGGEKVDPEALELVEAKHPRVVGHVIHWGKIWGLTVFAALAIAPVVQKRFRKP
ncbi:MAG: DUF1559 domain-containing protein [Planctomycetota bacterium]